MISQRPLQGRTVSGIVNDFAFAHMPTRAAKPVPAFGIPAIRALDLAARPCYIDLGVFKISCEYPERNTAHEIHSLA
jgi:hypothetical protein